MSAWPKSGARPKPTLTGTAYLALIGHLHSRDGRFPQCSVLLTVLASSRGQYGYALVPTIRYRIRDCSLRDYREGSSTQVSLNGPDLGGGEEHGKPDSDMGTF